MKERFWKKIKYYDVLAAVVCVAVFAFFFVRVRYGINRVDESFYLAVAQRFARGDRPLVDEWQLSQISDLFLMPFYRFFTAVTGGTEGIILFMRQMFLLFDLLFYWVLYGKLRSYGVWGMIATAVVSFYVPWAMFALNYYSMSPRLLVLICLLLMFGKKEAGRVRLLLAGVVLSAAVLIAPPLALLFAVYSGAVLGFEIAKKKQPEREFAYGFLCNRRTWLYITLAVAVCAGAFLMYLHFKSGLQNVFAALPELMSDSEYDFSSDGNVKDFLLSKLPDVTELLGGANLVLAVLLCVVVFVYVKRRNDRHGRLLLFLVSNLLLVSFCVWPLVALGRYQLEFWNHWYYFIVTPVPLYAFGLVNYLLCEEKDRKLFVVWILGVLSSTLIDSFSDVSFGVCGTLTAIPGILCFGRLLREFSAEKTESVTKKKPKEQRMAARKNTAQVRRQSRTVVAVSMAAFGLFLVWESANIYMEGTFQLAEEGKTASEKLDRGIYCGIHTTPELARDYNGLLADTDKIKAESRGPVYLDIPYPPAMLTLDLPSSNCSSWNSVGGRARQMRYLSMYPEKAPDILYYPTNDFFFGQSSTRGQEALFEEFARLLCDGTVTRGQQGIIVKVKSWRGPDSPAVQAWLSEHPGGF